MNGSLILSPGMVDRSPNTNLGAYLAGLTEDQLIMTYRDIRAWECRGTSTTVMALSSVVKGMQEAISKDYPGRAKMEDKMSTQMLYTKMTRLLLDEIARRWYNSVLEE